MSRSAAWLSFRAWSFFVVTWLAGCSYSLLISEVAVPNAPVRSESEVRRMHAILSGIAREYGLEEVNTQQMRDYIRYTSTKPSSTHRVLAWYVSPESSDLSVFLSLRVEKQTGAIEVLIRDHKHMGETPYTEEIRDAVVNSLITAFPGRRIESERRYDMPLYILP